MILASVMASTGFILCIICGYATHNRYLVDRVIHEDLVTYFLLSFTSPPIFLIPIGISFNNTQLAQFFLGFIIPVNILIYIKHIPHISEL